MAAEKNTLELAAVKCDVVVKSVSGGVTETSCLSGRTLFCRCSTYSCALTSDSFAIVATRLGKHGSKSTTTYLQYCNIKYLSSCSLSRLVTLFVESE